MSGGASAVLLLARSATTGAALKDMERLRDHAAGLPGVGPVVFAFAEEGTPSLRDALGALIDAGHAAVLIAPIVVPAEPAFVTGLRKALQRWRGADERPWPEIRIAPFPDRDLLDGLGRAADTEPVVLSTEAGAAEGSVVPAQKRRVLVCLGAPCIRAGAETVWGHLRNEQKRLGLRTAGEGTMSARTSCLGPCNLAPVVQVWPEGTLYGGIDEAGIDRIVEHHLQKGEIVEDLAYQPSGAKQTLRK
ncbi:MAG: (2Fe-2S) ferredoxin domain-containing protein [Reyranella sp.]|nr:(2Fe-2S) ferredoxin domain-containing protein [Reyranella sp.]MDP3158922.1 (2Fe-2S) ferredoxin domain-containing protein [Reyranella sp.]